MKVEEFNKKYALPAEVVLDFAREAYKSEEVRNLLPLRAKARDISDEQMENEEETLNMAASRYLENNKSLDQNIPAVKYRSLLAIKVAYELLEKVMFGQIKSLDSEEAIRFLRKDPMIY